MLVVFLIFVDPGSSRNSTDQKSRQNMSAELVMTLSLRNATDLAGCLTQAEFLGGSLTEKHETAARKLINRFNALLKK
jgi:hypothetical protein